MSAGASTLLLLTGLLFAEAQQSGSWKRVKPVDGVWSSWAEASPCSPCGPQAARSLSRTCSAPAPRWGGLACHGTDVTTQPCQAPCALDTIQIFTGNMHNGNMNPANGQLYVEVCDKSDPDACCETPALSSGAFAKGGQDDFSGAHLGACEDMTFDEPGIAQIRHADSDAWFGSGLSFVLKDSSEWSCEPTTPWEFLDDDETLQFECEQQE